MIVGVVFVVYLCLVTAHQDHQDSISQEVDNRRIGEQEWAYEGLPIEVPRRYALGGDRNIIGDTTVAPTTETTTTTEKVKFERGTRRIFNADEDCNIEEYPFMAAILVNNELWCGGVIISGDKILTAAHCLQLQYNNRFFREYVRMLSVRVGSTNATDGGQFHKVSEIYFHPNYVPQTLQFNLAVLLLTKNLSFYDHTMKKIEYSESTTMDNNANITFLGWGAVDELGDRGGTELLQKVELPIYNIRDCQDVYGKELVSRHNFCAGYITILKNVCNHDAGGPAILDGKLVGILSFSYSRCDVLDKPAVFSLVEPDWLDNIERRLITGYNIAG